MRHLKNGVLWSTMKYMIAVHSHPPCDLLSSPFTSNLFSNLSTKRLNRWCHVGRGVPTRWSSIELIF